MSIKALSVDSNIKINYLLKILCIFFIKVFITILLIKQCSYRAEYQIIKKRRKTLDCRISLILVTCDSLASDTCFTVKSPTHLSWALVGNHTDDYKKQSVVGKLSVSCIHWNINNSPGTLSIAKKHKEIVFLFFFLCSRLDSN